MTYKEYREKGLCPRCRKPNDNGGAYCDECRAKNTQYRRESVEFFKKNNLCIVCGKMKVYGKDNACEECTEKRRINSNRYYTNEREKVLERNRENGKRLRDKRKANGICIRCMRKAMAGRIKCGYHLELDRRMTFERRLKNG